MKKLIQILPLVFFFALSIWKTIESDSYMHKYWDSLDSIVVYQEEIISAKQETVKWSNKAIKFQNNATESLKLIKATSDELLRIQTQYRIPISNEYFTAYHKWEQNYK